MIDQAITVGAPIDHLRTGSYSHMQDSPFHRRFDSRAMFLVVAGLVLGTAGSALADDPAAPAPPADAPASEAPAPAPDPSMQAPPPAAEAPAPKNYVTAVIGTTPFFRPKGGPVADYIKDINPAIGYGRYVTPKLALELDVGVTLISGVDAAYYLVPGAVYSFSTYLYAAMRAVVYLNPEVDVILYPGFGGFYGLPNGLGFSLELNPALSIGNSATRGSFGVAVNFGVVYSF